MVTLRAASCQGLPFKGLFVPSEREKRQIQRDVFDEKCLCFPVEVTYVGKSHFDRLKSGLDLVALVSGVTGFAS